MDGKNASVIIQSGLAMVSGLALDLVKKHIFWADQGQGVIEHANYEGSQRSLLPIKEVLLFRLLVEYLWKIYFFIASKTGWSCLV
jgi:hypothetical protein